MAELHPEVRALLNGLQDSPLSWLARLAEDAVEGGSPEDSLKEDGTPIGRGRRELSIVDRVVVVELKNELAMTARIAEHAHRLGVKRVSVPLQGLPTRSARASNDQLLSPRRREAIEAFLSVWRDAVSGAAERIGG